MARRVFFSFHYDRDNWRVSQVRNCWVVPGNEVAGFWDGAAWESIKRHDEGAICRWIDQQLQGCSVTVVLIGAETATRKYVNYEIKQSIEQEKGILGIRIHSLLNQQSVPDSPGANPFDNFVTPGLNRQPQMSSAYPVYDWQLNNGRQNCGAWIELAARAAGR